MSNEGMTYADVSPHTPGPVQGLALLVLQSGLCDKNHAIRAAVDRVLNVPVYDAAPELLGALEAIMRLVPADIADTVAGHRASAAIKAAKGETTE